MRNTFLGVNDVVWFIGIVEDTNDPLQQGRVRVRIHGLHSKDPLELKTSDLPWAPVLMPTNMGGFQGSGYSPSGALSGATVMGIAMDGVACQYPIIVGVLMGNNMSDLNVPPGPFNNLDKPDLPKLKQDACEGYNYLKTLGYSDAQAAGIMGNLIAESGLNTNAYNPAGGGQGAYGLAQWRGPRQTALRTYAASRGTDQSDYATQLSFIDQEFKTTEKPAYAAIKNANTPEDAANAFYSKFERPGSSDTSGPKRAAYAREIANKCSITS